MTPTLNKGCSSLAKRQPSRALRSVSSGVARTIRLVRQLGRFDIRGYLHRATVTVTPIYRHGPDHQREFQRWHQRRQRKLDCVSKQRLVGVYVQQWNLRANGGHLGEHHQRSFQLQRASPRVMVVSSGCSALLPAVGSGTNFSVPVGSGFTLQLSTVVEFLDAGHVYLPRRPSVTPSAIRRAQ